MGVVPMIAVLLIVMGMLLLVSAFVVHRKRQSLPPAVAPAGVPGPRQRAPVRADVPHALYVYPPLPGGLSYYGISNEPKVRHRRHKTAPEDQWWFRRSTGAMHLIAWYPNRAAARAAEREAVRAAALRGERLGNTHHNPYARRRRSRAA